jgi:hypothetical protein
LGSKPGGGEILLLYNAYRFFPRLKRSGRGVDHPPNIAPRLKIEIEIGLSLFPLWVFVT